MKKYFLSIFIALIVGFFLAKTFLEQYESFRGLELTSNSGEMLYFIRYDTYDSLEEMEKKTLSLTNYIYRENNGQYDVYIGITKDADNLIKMNNYFSSIGYHTITEEFLVTNPTFLKSLQNYDMILQGTDDGVVISSISSQILEKYEEYVNGSED